MKRILLYIIIYIVILTYSDNNIIEGRIIEPLNSIREFLEQLFGEGYNHLLLPIIPMLVIYIFFDNRLKKLDKK